jgi:hypothetical protein
VTDAARRSRRFGWTALAAWALFGLAIEGAHGFKLGVYLKTTSGTRCCA